MKPRYFIIIVILFCLLLPAYGQNTNKKSDNRITITGKVLSIDKKVVEGAVFYIDSVKTTYKSRKDGSFKIKVSPSTVKLMVRSDDYGSCESLINGQTKIDFTLNGIAGNQSLKSGDAGEKKEAQESGYRVAKIKGKKMNTYNDIYQMIRGEVSGVVVSGKSVTIEQGHSFLGSSEPLFVVNGTIVNSIDYIDPLEVKSINVLKGSSAAIYGVRGSNGVISITLKNGTEKER